MVEMATAPGRFPSFADLRREHLDLMHRLRPFTGPMDDPQRRALIDNFMVRAKNTGAILDGGDRRAAQSILDYWSAEIVSASEMDENYELPKLRALEEPAIKSRPTADVIQNRMETRAALEFAALARRWKSSNDNGYLLTGRALEEAVNFQEDPDIAELVRASRIYVDGQERDRKRDERERKIKDWFHNVVAALAGVAVCLAAVAFWTMWMAKQEAANARRIAKGALSTVSGLLATVDNVDKGTGVLPIATAKQQLELARKLIGDIRSQPEQEVPQARVDLLAKLSEVADEANQREEALAYARDAMSAAEKKAVENPGDETWQHLLYESEFRIGDLLLRRRHDPEGAKPAYSRALQIAEHWAQKKPDNNRWQMHLAYMDYEMGDLQDEKDREQKHQWFQRGLELSEQHLKANPKSAEWLRYVANGSDRIGKLFNDENYLQKALKIRENLVDEYPQNRVYQANLRISYENIGNLACRLGNFGDAVIKYKNEIELADDLAKYDVNNIEYQVKLAAAYEHLGDALKGRNAPDDQRQAFGAYQDGLKRIDKFMQKSPEVGKTLEPTRKELQERIQGLPRDIE
jgi:tetratricopeptide (TPR) repeat protein